MYLLHYGLQRSGTNFLETLLKRKYQVHFLNSNKDRNAPIQKHFRLYDEKDIIPDPQYQNDIFISNFASFESLLKAVPNYYLVISKDPYSWLLSYEGWAKKCNWPAVSYHYASEYNLFYGKWLAFSKETERIKFIRYVDLIQDPSKVLGRLEAEMSLKKRFLSGLVSNTVKIVSQSSAFSDEKRNYYLNEKYLESYSDEDLREVNALIDPNVISSLGYERKGFVLPQKVSE